MQGLTERTNDIFEAISVLNCISGYTLIGGSALSLQIGHRLSEDLDFCRWSTNLKTDQPTVDWPQINKELGTIGPVENIDVLGFDQVNFIVSGVKISFLTKQENLSPIVHVVPILNNIVAADLDSIGAMKVEVMLRRSEWRDYYDIYSILREGVSLKSMIAGAGNYSRHRLKTRDALNFLSNSSNYKKEKNFELLKPMYNDDGKEIEEYIQAIIRKEFLHESI
jgi:hypothetical protein